MNAQTRTTYPTRRLFVNRLPTFALRMSMGIFMCWVFSLQPLFADSIMIINNSACAFGGGTLQINMTFAPGPCGYTRGTWYQNFPYVAPGGIAEVDYPHWPCTPPAPNQNALTTTISGVPGVMTSSSGILFNTCNGLILIGLPPINDAQDGVPGLNPPDNSGCGMPVWSVSQPYISLWLHDEPLGYQPAVGPRVSFELAFKQRESTLGFNTNLFSVGKRWDCSWLSYVTQDTNGFNTVNFPGGGQQTFYATNDYVTNTRLTGNTNSGFTLSYPDGSQNIYGLIVTNSNGAFQEAFLTGLRNAQGQQTTLNYYSNAPSSSPVVCLQSVIDGDGRTNLIYYVAANSYSTNLIGQVVDPFGRTNFLAYDSSGHLTNITDVAGNSTALYYDTNDWATNMITPYGTNSFAITDTGGANVAPNGRSVLVTQPDGSHELYLYQDSAAGVTNAYPTNQVPGTSPYTNTFDNSDLNLRNSFHWGPDSTLHCPRQTSPLSPPMISSRHG